MERINCSTSIAFNSPNGFQQGKKLCLIFILHNEVNNETRLESQMLQATFKNLNFKVSTYNLNGNLNLSKKIAIEINFIDKLKFLVLCVLNETDEKGDSEWNPEWFRQKVQELKTNHILVNIPKVIIYQKCIMTKITLDNYHRNQVKLPSQANWLVFYNEKKILSKPDESYVPFIKMLCDELLTEKTSSFNSSILVTFMMVIHRMAKQNEKFSENFTFVPIILSTLLTQYPLLG